ncbi:MAG: hypothetical protein ACR2OM_11330 [Aestuariivirgaceae bacterium]
MVERAWPVLKSAGPIVLFVYIGMNWLAHLTTLTVQRPVGTVTIAAQPERICKLLASKDALPDWFAWMALADEITVTRKTLMGKGLKEKAYVFRPETRHGGKRFQLSLGRPKCNDKRPLRVEMKLKYLDPTSLAAELEPVHPFARAPVWGLGEFEVEYRLASEGENTRVDFFVTSCVHPFPDNWISCWGELEITLYGMFEPLFRWPIETAIGESLENFKALAERRG